MKKIVLLTVLFVACTVQGMDVVVEAVDNCDNKGLGSAEYLRSLASKFQEDQQLWDLKKKALRKSRNFAPFLIGRTQQDVIDDEIAVLKGVKKEVSGRIFENRLLICIASFLGGAAGAGAVGYFPSNFFERTCCGFVSAGALALAFSVLRSDQVELLKKQKSLHKELEQAYEKKRKNLKETEEDKELFVDITGKLYDRRDFRSKLNNARDGVYTDLVIKTDEF